MTRSVAPSDVFDVIARVLVPYLGESMARAALQANRAKLRLHGATLGPGDLDRLLDALAPGLHVFVGDERTARLLDEIRDAVRRGAP